MLKHKFVAYLELVWATPHQDIRWQNTLKLSLNIPRRNFFRDGFWLIEITRYCKNMHNFIIESMFLIYDHSNVVQKITCVSNIVRRKSRAADLPRHTGSSASGITYVYYFL
jgi:hypothetical protein